MTKRKFSLMALSILLLLLMAYLLMRVLATIEADRETDAFFAQFSTAHQELFKKSFHLIGQDFTGALAVIERHSEAIANFNYKKTTPDINLVLNEAVVPVSWHLTIRFRKENSGWYVSKFDEYLASS